MRILDQLLNAGIEKNNDDSSIKERRIFNTFLFGTIAIAIPLGVISIIASKPLNSIVCFSAVALLVALYLLARVGYYIISKHLYLYMCLGVIVSIAYYNYTLMRFNGVENLLFPLILASSLLFRHRANLFQTVLIIASLLVLVFVRRQFEGLPFDGEFAIRTVISLMVAAAILILTQIYRFNERLLMKKMIRQKDILYALIDHVPVMMSLIDREKRFQIVNKPFADFLKKERQELIGAKCADVLPKMISEKHKTWCEKAIHQGPVSFNDDLILNDNKFSFTGKYVPIKDESGDVRFVSQHLVDISELKKIEASLKEANNAKNKLLSMLAHDIRSPLAMLSSTMQLDKSNELTPEEFSMLKNDINDKLTSLLSSLDTLLDWSRYQLDGIRTRKSSFYLHEVLHECIELHRDLAKIKGIEILVNDFTNEMVWADPNHMRLVLRNLIHNTIKFSRENQDVTITIVEAGTDICLSISDRGIGMDSDQLESVMAGSIQDSNEGTSGEKGNGLGLSLSLGLLKLNNLKYEIKSEPGEGTQVHVLMPVAVQV